MQILLLAHAQRDPSRAVQHVSAVLCPTHAPTDHPRSTALLQSTKTHLFNGPFSGTTRVSRYHKGKPISILLQQEIVSSSGISWAICKSAPRSRQPCQHPTTQFFTGRMPFLPSNQQRQSPGIHQNCFIIQCGHNVGETFKEFSWTYEVPKLKDFRGPFASNSRTLKALYRFQGLSRS